MTAPMPRRGQKTVPESKAPPLRPPTGESGTYWPGKDAREPVPGPWGPGLDFDAPMRIIITRWSRWRWGVHLTNGVIDCVRSDGGPYAFTRRRAEAKGRRMLRRYLAAQAPEEYEVDP